jgi:DNA-binding winged helix-turn-helix (wHTH) protein
MNGTVGFRFGEFEVRVADGALRRAGFRVRLQDLPFRLLVALAERPGELVTREELRRLLWPAETYGDFAHRLGGALNRLREALGDPGDRPRVIETVPRRGYRFCATVEWIEAEAKPAPAAASAAPAEDDRVASPGATSSGRLPRLVLAAALVLAVSTGARRVGPEDATANVSRELRVVYVVEGAAPGGPAGVRVTARVFDARTETPVWSGTFDADGADAPALQARIARAIAQAVAARVEVTSSPSARPRS